MVLLESLPLKVGSILPHFQLNDPNSDTHSSTSLMGNNGLLIKFTCNHCPYAIAIWDRFIALARHAKALGIESVAINPNIHPDYPEDSPENMALFSKNKELTFPYLVDSDQSVAKQYQAQCTPDIYLVKPDMSLYYHGRLDDNWKQESNVTKQDLKHAIELLSEYKPAPVDQFPSMGCSIKWQH